MKTFTRYIVIVLVMMISVAGVSCSAAGSGKDGQDGKSAYQIWLDNGHAGTETDFLNWLKGSPGEPGAAGKSAYQIWLDNGHTGTETDFLNWLKGSPEEPVTGGKSATFSNGAGYVLKNEANDAYLPLAFNNLETGSLIKFKVHRIANYSGIPIVTASGDSSITASGEVYTLTVVDDTAVSVSGIGQVPTPAVYSFDIWVEEGDGALTGNAKDGYQITVSPGCQIHAMVFADGYEKNMMHDVWFEILNVDFGSYKAVDFGRWIFCWEYSKLVVLPSDGTTGTFFITFLEGWNNSTQDNPMLPAALKVIVV